MLTLQSKEIVSYEDCIKSIEEMLNILKRETLFGKSHKNILDQYLYLSGLLVISISFVEMILLY